MGQFPEDLYLGKSLSLIACSIAAEEKKAGNSANRTGYTPRDIWQ